VRESPGGPVVELIRETETATHALAVVDRPTGELQYFPLRLDAVLVEIHDAEKRARAVADFTVARFGFDDHEHFLGAQLSRASAAWLHLAEVRK